MQKQIQRSASQKSGETVSVSYGAEEQDTANRRMAVAERIAELDQEVQASYDAIDIVLQPQEMAEAA